MAEQGSWTYVWQKPDSPAREAAKKEVFNFQLWFLEWLATVMEFNQNTPQSIWTRYFINYIEKVTKLRETHGEHLMPIDNIPSFGETRCHLQVFPDYDGMNVLLFKFTPEGTFTFEKFMFDEHLRTITNCLDTDVLNEFQLTAEEALHKEYKSGMLHGSHDILERIFENNTGLKTNLDGSLKT